MIETPINETLPATGGTPVLLNIGTSGCKGWVIQAVGSVAMEISDTSAMTKKWTVKSGTSLALDQVLGANASVCYAISGGAEDAVQLIKTKL